LGFARPARVYEEGKEKREGRKEGTEREGWFYGLAGGVAGPAGWGELPSGLPCFRFLPLSFFLAWVVCAVVWFVLERVEAGGRNGECAGGG